MSQPIALCIIACFSHMQAITDMVIANESRVAKSRVVTTFNRARQVLINVAIRCASWPLTPLLHQKRNRAKGFPSSGRVGNGRADRGWLQGSLRVVSVAVSSKSVLCQAGVQCVCCYKVLP